MDDIEPAVIQQVHA